MLVGLSSDLAYEFDGWNDSVKGAGAPLWPAGAPDCYFNQDHLALDLFERGRLMSSTAQEWCDHPFPRDRREERHGASRMAAPETT